MIDRIDIAGEEILLDSSKLEFNEANLSKYMEEEATWYDYFGRKLADAEFLLQSYENEEELKYSEKYIVFKEAGSTDKLAEAKAKADPEVDALRKQVIITKKKVKMLQQHLRAFDKSHENSQSRAYTLNKEADKFKLDIRSKSDLEAEVDEIIRASQK